MHFLTANQPCHSSGSAGVMRISQGGAKPHFGQVEVDCATAENGKLEVMYPTCSHTRRSKSARSGDPLLEPPAFLELEAKLLSVFLLRNVGFCSTIRYDHIKRLADKDLDRAGMFCSREYLRPVQGPSSTITPGEERSSLCIIRLSSRCPRFT